MSRDGFDSEDSYDLVHSNISVINALFEQFLTDQEISRDALKSYYVDYFLAQAGNGGFSQFVFNSQWNPRAIALIKEGLRDMGAARHLAAFEEGAAFVEGLAPDELAAYLQSEYFGDNATRDRLNAIDDNLHPRTRGEDLVELNAQWLKRHPALRVLPLAELRAEVDRRAAAVPDRDQRLRAARDAEPLYTKLVRALCEQSGQTLDRLTAGNMNLVYDGDTVRDRRPDEPAGEIVWSFITDAGLHFMAQAHGKAAMFDKKTGTKIAEIDIPDQA